ncbi:MAG TPA: hypothetical protein VIQ00_06415 [Chitinophagaceae bacterium]|jgi:hypothetical protein
MKSTILLLAFSAALLSSCTTAYKTGQTPDDVYFSPERQQDEYVQVDNKNDRYYQSDDDYYEDRYLRMKVQDRYRWSDLDDYYYNNRYAYGSFGNVYYNNPWNPYNYWNHYYNPYYPSVIILNPKTTTTYNRPRTVNLNAYNNNQLLNNNYSNPKVNNAGHPVRVLGTNSTENRNGNSNRGQSLRDAFRNNNSTQSTNTNPTRTSTNTSSNTTSSSDNKSSSGTTNAPRRKF